LFRERSEEGQAMASPYLIPDPHQVQPTGLKRLLLRSAAFGAAFAATLCVILGGFVWYSNRPQPPRIWNTTAVVAGKPPAFDVTEDGETVKLWYSVENTTDTDYDIDSDQRVKVTLKGKNGFLSPPFSSEEFRMLQLPIFIPAKQKALVFVKFPASHAPQRVPSDSDAQYHERILAYCAEYFKNMQEIVLFDDLNHYQINLPRWRCVAKEP